MRGVQDLEVYRRAYAAALQLHRHHRERRDDVADQLRRASKSVVANLAEAYCIANSKPERKRILGIALRECDEVKVWLDFSRDLGYLTESESARYRQEYQEMGAILYTLWKRQV